MSDEIEPVEDPPKSGLPRAGGTTDSSVVDTASVFEPSDEPTGADMMTKDMFDPEGGGSASDRRQ